MAERTSVPETRKTFEPNDAIERAITAKIEAALAGGVNLLAMLTDPAGEGDGGVAFDQIDFTADEKAYMHDKALHDMVAAAIGERVVQTLDQNGCRIARRDLVPSILAYFEQNPAATLDTEPVEKTATFAPAADRSHSITIEDDTLQTEAEGLFNVLHDLGLMPAIRLGPSKRLLFELGDGTKPSALDVALLVETRFMEDDSFQDDFLDAVSNAGNLYVEAPGWNRDLQTAAAVEVVNAVIEAGFQPMIARLMDGDQHLVFVHSCAEERDLSAVDLIRLLERRYRDEPDFRTAVLRFLSDNKQTLAFVA